jgi:hypothetical protein
LLRHRPRYFVIDKIRQKDVRAGMILAIPRG